MHDPHILQVHDGIPSAVICTDGRPARSNQTEDIQLVEVQRCHFQKLKLRVDEAGMGIVEGVVLGHRSDTPVAIAEFLAQVSR